MKKEPLSENVTKRYLLAVSIIALLGLFTFTILHVAMKSTDSTALIVNMSGKQRMLSQRIASLSQRYVLAQNNPSEYLTLKTSLQATIDEMRHANTALSTGSLSPHIQTTLSPEMNALYFGLTDLYKRVEHYLLLAEQLLNASSHTQMSEHVQTLLLRSDTLLLDLDKAVKQYQKEGEAQIVLIKNLEIAALILTFIVLLLEIIFIFKPMANTIKELLQKASWQYHELEQQVRVRTLDLEQSNHKLSHLASHDPLTGLKNRLHLEEELERLMLHYKVNRLPYSVAMFDIDWFKKINDTFGHDAGDFVLRELAHIFLSTTRHEDTVFRSGGEEFVIIFNRIKPEDVISRCELLRERVQEHRFVYDKHDLAITISGGIYHPDACEAQSMRDILKYADTALYTAKQKGRNKIIMASAPKE